jgi:hypothetical protein
MLAIMGRAYSGEREVARGTRSGQAVGAPAEEFEEMKVTKDLELLADFVGDVGVLGVEFGQLVGVSVDIG